VKTGPAIIVFLVGFILVAAADRLLHTPPQTAVPVRTQAAGDPADTDRGTAAGATAAGQAPARVAGTPLENPLWETTRVKSVIDGDTLVVAGRRTVRLLGVDTPERGEPFFGKARGFLQAAVLERDVRLEFCEEERRDRYGRLLAFVEAGGKDAGVELLDRGLARTLFVGPCVRSRAPDYRRREREAFRAKRGIWSLQVPRRADHREARKYVGWLMTVTGTVRKVFVGPRAVHINFGPDYRTDFTAVIYRRDLSRLSGDGLLLPVTGYKDRRVAVTGVIKEYNGPEIIVRAADQIVPLP